MAADKIKASEEIRAIEEVINNGKIGELAKKQALDFGNQIATLKSNVLNLFADVNTGPFLDALHSLVMLFDDSTTSGQVLKSAITGIMDTLFSLATDAIPYVRIGFKLLENAGLRIYIFYKEFTAAHSELIDKIVLGFEAIGAVIAGAAALWLAFQTVMIGGAIAIGLGIIAGIGWIVDQFIWLGQNIDEVLDLFSPTKTYEAAAKWIDGLVQGIKDGAVRVFDAVSNMAQGALDKFTGFFGIKSPSRIMMGMGANLMTGLDKGISANDTGPQAALQDSVQPSAPAAPGNASAPGRGGGTTTVNIGQGAIVLNGVANVEQLRQVLPGELAAMFEQLGLSVGAA
jgi:phage-related protein